MITYRHDAALAGLSNPLDAELEKAGQLIDHYRNAPLPLFDVPAADDDIAPMQDMAAALSDGAKRIIILGTGGSSLGAQVLAQINGWGTPGGLASGAELIFADNLDATSFSSLLAPDRLATTRFLVVSKSGGTAETMMQLSCALSAVATAGLDIAGHFGGIAGAGDNTLRQVAGQAGFPLIDHADGIGGRFSVLTNVGLLPAIWAGLDPREIRQGAATALARLTKNSPAAEIPPAMGAVLQMAHARQGRQISVLMPYADRLERLGFWYRQLWAESLGKQGHGTLPVNALGPVDQHSQLQLYLAGPDDKFYTVLTHPSSGDGPVADADACNLPELDWLQNRAMGDLVAAEASATITALQRNKRPTRHIELPDISAATIGELLMHFMLETILAAGLLGIDAFDQPAVEEGKIIAKKLMAGN